MIDTDKRDGENKTKDISEHSISLYINLLE